MRDEDLAARENLGFAGVQRIAPEPALTGGERMI
jgi:hypothetical protein